MNPGGGTNPRGTNPRGTLPQGRPGPPRSLSGLRPHKQGRRWILASLDLETPTESSSNIAVRPKPMVVNQEGPSAREEIPIFLWDNLPPANMEPLRSKNGFPGSKAETASGHEMQNNLTQRSLKIAPTAPTGLRSLDSRPLTPRKPLKNRSLAPGSLVPIRQVAIMSAASTPNFGAKVTSTCPRKLGHWATR